MMMMNDDEKNSTVSTCITIMVNILHNDTYDSTNLKYIQL